MRIILLFLCLLYLPGFAQNFSLKQLLKFRQEEQAYITQKLTKKGWTFMLDNKPTEEMMGRAVWAFNPVMVGNMEAGAEAWCVFYYSRESSSRILYNYFGQETMRKINKRIRQKAMISIDNGNELRGVSALSAYTDFMDRTLVFRIMTYEFPNKFGIKIFVQEDYLEAKRNDRL